MSLEYRNMDALKLNEIILKQNRSVRKKLNKKSIPSPYLKNQENVFDDLLFQGLMSFPALGNINVMDIDSQFSSLVEQDSKPCSDSIFDLSQQDIVSSESDNSPSVSNEESSKQEKCDTSSNVNLPNSPTQSVDSKDKTTTKVNTSPNSSLPNSGTSPLALQPNTNDNKRSDTTTDVGCLCCYLHRSIVLNDLLHCQAVLYKEALLLLILI